MSVARSFMQENWWPTPVKTYVTVVTLVTIMSLIYDHCYVIG